MHVKGVSAYFRGLAAVCLLWWAPPVDAAATLTHGPMLASVTPVSAVVWVRSSAAATLNLESSLLGDFTDAHLSASVTTSAASDFTAHLSMTGLPADAIVSYRVWLGGTLATPIKQFRTAPPVGTPLTVRIPVFSDWARSQKFPGLQVALDRGAPFVVFLGDFDHSNPVGKKSMWLMHRNLRSTARGSLVGPDVVAGLVEPPFQVPLYHVWDDHDYAGDNTDKYTRKRDDARAAFRDYYPLINNAGGPGTAIDQRFSYGFVDVFVPDLRSERDDKDDPDTESKSMLGVVQKTQLKAGLLASTATWKIIASSVPWNPTSKNDDSWRGYQTEQQELVAFIRDNTITGVLIASGDMHTGGGIDDGTTSFLPEINCPKANKTFNDTGKFGTWSEGIDHGNGKAGFCEFLLTPTSATLSVVGDNGGVRRSLTIPAP